MSDPGYSRRRFLGRTGTVALGSSVFASGYASACRQTENTVTIIHDSYFNGLYNDRDNPENIANYFGLIDTLREETEDSLVLGKGNDISPSVMTTLFSGRHTIDAMNAGGIEYNTFGNHDFDLGSENLIEVVDRSEFPWVSANVVSDGDVFARDVGATQYALHDVGDLTVGITGLLTEQAPELTSMGDNVDVRNPIEAANAVVPAMREAGADIVVVLSHLNQPTPETVAREVEGIDVILGDRTATVLENPEMVNGTLLSFVGSEFDHVGELALTIDGSRVAEHEFTLHTLEEAVEAGEVTPHPQVQRLQCRYNATLERELDVVIGQTTEPLDVTRETLRRTESNFGNFVADAIRTEAGADIGLMNSGGMRTDTVYDAGEITRRLVAEVLPFQNTVVALEATGAQLLEALENGVSQVDVDGATGTGRFPQVSGLSFSYDPTATPGQRVVSAEHDGEAIDPDASYVIGTNDFIASGGDGYDVFADLESSMPSENVPLLSTLVIDTIEAAGTISPATEGRIELTSSTP